MIPAMTELMGPQQHLYQAAALIVTFFVAVPALVQHARVKAIDNGLFRRVIPFAAGASVLGVDCSELPVFRGAGSVYLTGLFGVFLFYVAAFEIRRFLRPGGNGGGIGNGVRDGRGDGVDGGDDVVDCAGRGSARSQDHERAAIGWGPAFVIGGVTGLVSGFLGVGGGVVAVPLQRRLLGTNLRVAIANSAAMIVVLSTVGTVAKHTALVRNHPEYAWYDPASLAILLIPTAIVGAWFGGRLTHVLPLTAVRVAFVVLLLVAGVRLAWRAVSGYA